MKPKTFKQVMGRMPQRRGAFSMEAQRPAALDPSALFHYWHPDRPGVEACPAWFAEEIAKVGPDLRVVRPPAGAVCSQTRSHCWLVWVKQPRVTHHLSPGWMLLVAWHSTDREQRPLPLDNRLIANLHLQSIRGGRELLGRDFKDPVEYFDTIMAISAKEKAAREASHLDDLSQRAADYDRYRQIKNIGHGSKFPLHHDGTLAPGRGESAWLKERERDLLPADILKQRNEEFRRPSHAPTVVHDGAKVAHRQAVEQFKAQLRDLQVRKYLRDRVAVQRRARIFT